MPHLVSRIVLGTLIVPMGLMVLLTVLQFLQHIDWQHEQEIWISGGAMNLFIVGAWIALWRKLVRWSARRWAGTVLAFVAAAVIASAAGWYINEKIWWDLGLLSGLIIAPLLWMFMTALLWRETASEHAARYLKPAAVN